MMKPHKHAELIKAWADGAEIEFYHINENEWNYCPNPMWCEDEEYRIKPEQKPDVFGYLVQHGDAWFEYEAEQVNYEDEQPIRPQIKVIWNDDEQLKSAEVLK